MTDPREKRAQERTLLYTGSALWEHLVTGSLSAEPPTCWLHATAASRPAFSVTHRDVAPLLIYGTNRQVVNSSQGDLAEPGLCSVTEQLSDFGQVSPSV